MSLGFYEVAGDDGQPSEAIERTLPQSALEAAAAARLWERHTVCVPAYATLAHVLVKYVAADAETPWTSSRAFLVVLAALLGFVSAYVIEIIKSRRSPRKVLSWDVSIEEPQLKSRAVNRDQLKISYLGREVGRLITVRYSLSNSGTLTVKNQYVRFKIPNDAQLLVREIDPVPEPEIGLEDLTDSDPSFSGPRYKISHLEPGQAVSMFFASDGGTWQAWDGAVLHNDEGGITYRRRDVAQGRDDEASLRWFLFGISALLIVTTLLGLAALAIWLLTSSNLLYINDVAYLSIVVTITLVPTALGVYLLSSAFRAVRFVTQRIARISNGRMTLQSFGESWIAYATQGGQIKIETQANEGPSEYDPDNLEPT